MNISERESMDRDDVSSFCEKFENSCRPKVAELRAAILRDVKENDGQIISIMNYSKYLIALPPLNTFPQEFRDLFKDKYIDLDMQDDLERAEVINWCRTTKPVYAVRTTGDGNCLLHAVSQGLWGIEDSELFLRRLLYVNLVTDPKGAFKRRWMFHQKNSTELNQFDVWLNTAECVEEWESVIKATDDVARSQSHGLPYTALESIHLYVTANMLRRPIILLADTMARTVFGETIQDSQINGIYFPLEWPPEQCDKNPLVIGYNMNHFAPLVFEDVQSGQNDVSVLAMPLVTKDMDSIPARFLMPDEEVNYANIFRNYLNTTEVFSGTTILPAANVKLVQLPETVNIIDACRKDCERKFRRLVDPVTEATVPPFNFQTAGRKEQPVQQRQNVAPANVQKNTHRKRCATIGCEHFANPETQNLCSKCFKDFTIQYHRQEEAARKATIRQQLLPTHQIPFRPAAAPARQESRGNNYHDLSMMGEDCLAGCGFKCSTETYPYCHECYPKFVKTETVAEQVTQPEPQRQPTKPELSIMPETCLNCSYRCSKATFPYCHDCFPKFTNHAHAVPTAPPPSVPAAANQSPGSGGMRVPTSDQTAVVSSNRRLQQNNKRPLDTHVSQSMQPVRQVEPMEVQSGYGELSRKCRTLHCNNFAIKGNNGYCDTCYQLTLFGSGTSPTKTTNGNPAVTKCSTTGCDETVGMSGTTQCIGCFLKGDGSQKHSLTGGHTQNMGMNIVPSQEKKILNSGASGNARTHDKMPIFSMSGASMRSIPAEHDERAEEPAGNAPIAEVAQAEQQMNYQSEENRKYICATPGCEGLRNENELGLCFTCMKNTRSAEGDVTAQSQSGSNLYESELLVSCTPIEPTEAEMKKLNPVVVSSRDKIKCSSPACQTLIYPPKRLCDECSAVLEKFQAQKAKEESRNTVGTTGSTCLTQGCLFYGSPQFQGYCSSCAKAKETQARYTAPIVKKSSLKSNTAPILAGSQPIDRPLTEPIFPRKAKLCIEKDCTRYGDPSQLERCSYHFQKASALFPPMSPESVAQNQQILAQQLQQHQTRTHTAETRHQVVTGSSPYKIPRQEAVKTHGLERNSQTVSGPSPSGQRVVNGSANVDPFEASYNKLFKSKRSNSLCKNNSATGCTNYGNSAKGGYCNTCYPQIQREQQSGYN